MGTSCKSKDDQLEKWKTPEIESALFPTINACGVQYHPEWMGTTTKGFLFFYNMVNKLINLPRKKFIQFYIKGNKSGKHRPTPICTCNNNVTG